MSTFVLVHGSWHGAWCWDKLTSLLERSGQRVLAPDLPGHGDDTTPISAISMDSYVQRVRETIDAAGEPVVLVGHSMAGTVISQVAELLPERIETLVYLCAFLVQDGESLFSVAQSDTQSLILPNLIPDEAGGHMWIRDEAIRETFYHDCTADDAAWAQSRLCLEPAAPVMTPVRISAERYGRVPRVYIVCTQDQALGPDHQRLMESRLPCHRVIEMDAGHSPFIAQPEALAGHLLKIATPVGAIA
jgi:pimeloyl-ACP methyl ester carboxylesterase